MKDLSDYGVWVGKAASALRFYATNFHFSKAAEDEAKRIVEKLSELEIELYTTKEYGDDTK